ncbi:MAG: hypothetical protein P4L59_00180 [Desulfosporosinus sp.]|nr:hypothetical protein [Desulfosporosinus sp.]
MNESKMVDQILQNKLMYKQLSIEHWLRFEVFTWQWWIGIAFIILPILVWWKLVDKRRILVITTFGFLVNILATVLDITGSELVLWHYTIRILPQIPLLFPVDFVMVPIAYMLVFQRYRAWQQFILASAIVALCLAFILEPLAVYIKQYQLISWHYIYSFPIYILISIFSKLITDNLLSRQEGT